jgi:O-antigen/teichoic acid export membrane protein
VDDVSLTGVTTPPAAAPPLVVSRPSLTRNSAARLTADAASLLAALIASVIVARALGPSGKGLYSAFTFLASLVLGVSSLGVGEAAIILIGQRRATASVALSSTMLVGMSSSLLGAAVFWGVSAVAFSKDWNQVHTAIEVQAAALPLMAFASYLSQFLLAGERVPASSTVFALINWSTTIGLWLFMVVLNLGLLGGALAGLTGAACGAVLATVLVVRPGMSLLPRWHPAYIAKVMRFGPPLAASSLVAQMFQRADLLLVYSMAGSSAAGNYSIGLTVVSLVGLVPLAISLATFPRIAMLERTEQDELIAQCSRVGAAAALVTATVLAASSPVVIPLLFGAKFEPAVVPTLLLIPNGVFWSFQWLLARAWAARGQPGLLVSSFGTSLVAMLTLDIILIPVAGITGAAVASSSASALGLGVCLWTYARSPSWIIPLPRLFPRASDFRFLGARATALFPLTAREPNS